MGLVLQYQLEKLVLTVAATAVQAETTVVNILTLMTFTTDGGRLVGIRAWSMTGITGEPFVGTLEGIAGKFFVIELPEIPAVGRVAAVTGFTERALVMVILFVAAHTIGVGSRKLIADMATLARHHIVKTDQGEVGEVVVETIDDLPIVRDMAGGTHLHVWVLVDVTGGVAGGTVARQIILQSTGVAVGAGERLVMAG